jgi:hypothetical protein
MARSHIVSPLPAEYLRHVVKMLRKFADAYESAAEALSGSDVSALHAEKFSSLIDGVDRIKSHFDQVADGVRRSEVAALWEQIKEEPLPDQRYDKTKGGHPQAAGSTKQSDEDKAAADKLLRKSKGKKSVQGNLHRKGGKAQKPDAATT